MSKHSRWKAHKSGLAKANPGRAAPLERQEHTWKVLEWFDHTPRTEAAFYILSVPRIRSLFVHKALPISYSDLLRSFIRQPWRPAEYRRPYGPKAPWNVPAREIPLHPESDKYAKLMYEYAPANRPGNFNLNFDVNEQVKCHACQLTASLSCFLLLNHYISLLTEDYLDQSGTLGRVFVNKWREAPALFKHDGKYYMITSACTGWSPSAAEIAVADSIFGEWTVLGNPCLGPDSDKTFYGQSTFVLPVQGKKNGYIFMADRWIKEDLGSSKYIWLPIQIKGNQMIIEHRFSRGVQPS